MIFEQLIFAHPGARARKRTKKESIMQTEQGALATSPTAVALGLCDPPILRFSDFKTEERLACGAYGIVYRARERGGNQRVVAVKRNISTIECHGICVLREIDHLTRVVGHPYVIDIAGVVLSGGKELFNEPAARVKGFSDEHRDDLVHFIFAMEKTDLSTAIQIAPLSPNVFKIVAMQILLAVEWIHARGVAHRDIKPSNVLFNRSNANPHIRLCDFGLSGILAGSDMKSPGLVTKWYRAPEITIGLPYGPNVDIWSVGVVFIELLTRRVPVKTRGENRVSIIKDLLELFPELASLDTIESLGGDSFAANVLGSLSEETKRIVETSIYDHEERVSKVKGRVRKFMELTAKAAQDFNDAPAAGSLDELCDLIARMLSFDPDRRPSASECLEHPFFSKLEKPIKDMRQAYLSPMPPPLFGALPATISSHEVVIRASSARSLVCRILAELWWQRSEVRWYDHRIIFHTLDTLDRVFEHAFDPRAGEAALTAPLTNRDKRKLYIQTYALLYTYHKYFTTLQKLEDWRDFVPEGYGGSSAARLAEEFELFVVREVCRFQVYRATVFELMVAMSDGEIHENAVRNCLAGLVKPPPFWVGTIDSLLTDAMAGFSASSGGGDK